MLTRPVAAVKFNLLETLTERTTTVETTTRK